MSEPASAIAVPSLPRRLVGAAYRSLPFKRQLFGVLRHAPVPERLYRHLHFAGPFYVAVGGGRTLHWQSYGDIVENSLFWEGVAGFEPKSLETWSRLAATASGTVLDIGANSGLFACLAKLLNRALTVIAFEPLARVAKRLRRNVARNGGDIIVVEAAVSDKAGHAMIHDSDDPQSDRNAYSASLETGFDFNTIAYPVETIALDHWAAKPTQPVSLIKLDVELHEPAAIAGMIGTIRADRPAILVEILSDAVADGIAAQIAGLDYRFFAIDEQRGLLPRSGPVASSDENRNVLICTAAQFDAANLAPLLAANESQDQ